MTWEPDSVVGSYRIVKTIGRGGMGSVFEAIHTVLRRRAAIKVMHGELRKQPGMATRMVQEAAILDDIRHPGIVRVYECNLLPDHRPFIAVELVEGDTLANRLSRCSKLPPIDVATLLSQLCDCLAAVHARGIVHRDLKPDNILLTPGNREYPLRIIDWGVARLGPAGRLTLDGLTPGTPIYMSPEQAMGTNIAAPCDIYSLGVIAYEALTGHPPFDGRTLAEVVCMHLTGEAAPLQEQCSAPAELCELIHRMLEKAPALRPGTIEVRQISRALALELSGAASAYEEFELSGVDAERSARVHASQRIAAAAISIDTEAAESAEETVVDPESLEYGVTELVPIARKPRWTPEIGQIVSSLTSQSQDQRTRPITPRSARDQVAGEIVTDTKRRP